MKKKIKIQELVVKILQYYEPRLLLPSVKLVVGMKLFRRKQTEIKAMVENSSHFRSVESSRLSHPSHSHTKTIFREEQEFVASVLGKDVAARLFAPPPSNQSSMIDKYADAFEEFERGQFSSPGFFC